MARRQYFAPTNRKALVEAQGLRPLTSAEQRQFGLARGYVPAGKKLTAKNAASLFVSRRQAEQGVLNRTFEAVRNQRALATGGRKVKGGKVEGGRTQMTRYQTILREYAARNNLTLGQARRDPGMKAIVKGLRSKNTSAGGPKARALVALGRREPDWRWDVGDTPKFGP